MGTDPIRRDNGLAETHHRTPAANRERSIEEREPQVRLASLQAPLPSADLSPLRHGQSLTELAGDVIADGDLAEEQSLGGGVGAIAIDPGTHSLPIDSLEIAHLAAMNAPLAEIFQLEKDMNACLEQRGHSQDDSGPTMRRLLDERTRMARQSAAEQALELFFTVHEVDQQQAVLERIDQLLEQSAAAQRAISDSGTDVDVDPHDLPLQELELQGQLAKLASNRRQANAALLALIGYGANSDHRIVPLHDTVLPSELEPIEQSIATGLAQRSELQMHRLVLCQSADAALPAMSQTLQYADTSLGIAPFNSTGLSLVSLLFHNRDRKRIEAEYRRRQIQQLERETTDAITTEIVTAHHAVSQQWEQIAIASSAVQRHDDRVRFHEQRRDTKKFDYAALQASRLDRLRAESELVGAIHAFHRARVDLAAAKGTILCEAF